MNPFTELKMQAEFEFNEAERKKLEIETKQRVEKSPLSVIARLLEKTTNGTKQ